MTYKLYYENSYLDQFEGQVINCEKYKDDYVVELDQTAFYPEGGGQPADTGVLDGVEVKFVFDKAHKIYHVIDKPLTVGKVVEGKVDIQRRYDYMQQHSGEHIISGIVNREYGYNNIGFHMSKEYMTADFDGKLSKEDIEKIEMKANQVVFQNRSISATIYSGSELAEKQYRSKLDLKDDVRIVSIPECDTCACCGTHLGRTGEIGLIKILSSEKYKGGTRLTIVCGQRALEDYKRKIEVVTSLSTLLSAKEDKILDGVVRVQEELAKTKQKLVERTNRLFEFKIEEYKNSDEKVIVLVEQQLIPDELRRLGMRMAEQTSKICAVMAIEDEEIKYVLSSKEEDIRELCKALNKEFEGRGGGKPNLCQGSLKGNSKAIISFIQEFVK